MPHFGRCLPGLLALSLLVTVAPASAQSLGDKGGWAPSADPSGPRVRPDLGLHLNLAAGGVGGEQDGSTSDDTAFGFGLGIGGHAGILVEDFMATVLVHAGFFVGGDDTSSRSYAGVGPALLVGWRPVLNDDGHRLSIELGGGFDYGISQANGRRAEGVFPTVHARVMSSFGGFSVGLHLLAAIPPDAPDLVGLSGGVVLGLRTP